MAVNDRVREIRRELNLSQREFAKAVYVSNGYLSEIENGQKEVNDRLIHLISNTFSVNKYWLLTGEERMFYNSPDDKIERLTGLFSELQPEYQDFVLRQIDELLALQRRRREGPENQGKTQTHLPPRPVPKPKQS